MGCPQRLRRWRPEGGAVSPTGGPSRRRAHGTRGSIGTDRSKTFGCLAQVAGFSERHCHQHDPHVGRGEETRQRHAANLPDMWLHVLWGTRTWHPHGPMVWSGQAPEPIHQESGVGHNHRQFSPKTKSVCEKRKQNDQTIPCAKAISTRGQIEEQTTNISRIISYHIYVSTTSTARRPTVDNDPSITRFEADSARGLSPKESDRNENQ